jgi:hypothetical protein
MFRLTQIRGHADDPGIGNSDVGRGLFRHLIAENQSVITLSRPARSLAAGISRDTRAESENGLFIIFFGYPQIAYLI